MKNDIDSIAWIRLNKNYFNIEEDCFVFFVFCCFFFVVVVVVVVLFVFFFCFFFVFVFLLFFFLFFFAVTYIPPENSVYHRLYDVDIFQKLEDELCFYKTKGKIALSGDLNCRIGRKCDFIENNYYLLSDFYYTLREIPTRKSMDSNI